MHRLVLFPILISFSITSIWAQSIATSSLSSTHTGSGKVYFGNPSEPPRAIEFNEGSVTTSHFLANINSYFNLSSEFTFMEVEANTDHLNMRHRFLQQYYKDVPIEGMGYRVHEKNGFVTSANGRIVRDLNPDMNVLLSEEDAFHLAVGYLKTNDTTVTTGKKLIVSRRFTFTPESFAIAFQFDIDVSFIERWRISIDGRTGELINKVSLVNSCGGEPIRPLPYTTGTGLTNYYGSQTIRVEQSGTGSRLRGQTQNGGKVETYDFQNNRSIILELGLPYTPPDFYSSDNTYTSTYQKAGVSTQWGAEQVYEYYYKKHNRNSFDNNGATIKCYVHVDVNLNNAFWNGKVLAFGDGTNNTPPVELDVVGHELTHGITQYEAGLQYAYESGALNESFSDILGKAIEFYTFGDSATWQIGKHYRDGGIRDFSNPNLKQQPDTYEGDFWVAGDDDYGGVHYNSGVQNFWFYLLCEGGSGVNDRNENYSINAIGLDKAVNIAYRNLTEYLSYNSDYLDSRIGSLLATADLYGKNSAAYQEVDKAWDAVGVTDEPIIKSLGVYDITATTVRIKGDLIPRGNNVAYYFEYGTTPAYGNVSDAYTYTDAIEGSLTGLQSMTKYYLRLVASNENGESYATTAFTTTTLAPLVKIRRTVDITETTAVLYGLVNPNSLPTSFYFEYGPTVDLGLRTPMYPLNDTTEFLNISASIQDLQLRRTYFYRLVATNEFSSSATEVANFLTAMKPVISSFSPVSAPIGTEITITGENFNTTAEKNLVSFGAVHGLVLSSSATELKVKVPAGASFGTLSLLDIESGLLAKSSQEFVPTYTGEFNISSLQLRVGISDLNIREVLVQDMDGDSKPDIVALHSGGFSVFQNVNQGGDITEESFIRSTRSLEYSLSDLALVDFDGNGLKDVVGHYLDRLRVYPNLSVPGFIFFGTPVDISATSSLNYPVFNDFDNDGRVDIALSQYKNDKDSLLIIRNRNLTGILADENFEKSFSMPLSYHGLGLNTGDLNNDERPELLISTFENMFLPIIENNSDTHAFHFQENNITDTTTFVRFSQYSLQDLNQDGWKDVVLYSTYGFNNLGVFQNKSDLQHVDMRPPVILQESNSTSAIKPGDMDGDGKVDLVMGLQNRTFTYFKNQAEIGEQLADSSFVKLGEYGMALGNVGSGKVETKMVINDLNGDGRPEVITSYSYNFGPHDGYQMEIWQNSPSSCLDPSLIKLNVSRYSATIVLPPGTTFDQFEIDYAFSGNNNWMRVNSTSVSNLQSGRSYQLRVRAKCYLYFTGYHYINFITECVDMNSFSVEQIDFNSVVLNSYQLSSFEIEYSLAGKNQWTPVPQYVNHITNLIPGTRYDLRYRGRCVSTPDFTYTQFTTLCPKLSTLTITDLSYNKAVANWTSSFASVTILEYSPNNVTWTLMDETQTMFPLIPGKKYFVRGSQACTDTHSDFIYTSLTTPCPEISMLKVDGITPFSAHLSWQDESSTGNYIVRYSVAEGGTVTKVETNDTSLVIDGLTPGTSYTLSAAPKCISPEDYQTTSFNTICYVPYDLVITEVTYSTAQLSWSDQFSGVPYFIDYAISGSNVWITRETASTSILLSELRPGTRYEARIHIECLSEVPPYISQSFETHLYEQTKVAPNPTDRKITIFPATDLIGHTFSMYDNTGKQVAGGNLQDYQMDLSAFAPGFYLLSIEGEKPLKIIKY